MVDLEQSLERLKSDSQFQITVGLTVFFLAIFPAYFAYAASVGGTGGFGPSGTWLIEYEETIVESGDETIFVEDGSTGLVSFYVPKHEGLWLGVIHVNISYSESDESGVWLDQCDDVTAEIDASELSGYIEGGSTLSVTSTDCGNYGMEIVLELNYTGEDLIREGTQSEWGEKLGEQDDNGRGNVSVSISVDTNSGSKPGPLDPGPASNNEDGEDVIVFWEVIAYELSFSPVDDS